MKNSYLFIILLLLIRISAKSSEISTDKISYLESTFLESNIKHKLSFDMGIGVPGTAFWGTPLISSTNMFSIFGKIYISPLQFNQSENIPYYISIKYSFINHLEAGLNYTYSLFKYDNKVHITDECHSFKARINYVKNFDKQTEFYAGIGWGCRFGNYQINYPESYNLPDENNNVEKGKILLPSFEGSAGVRLFLIPQIAWYFEVGFNRSILQTGFSFKFDYDE